MEQLVNDWTAQLNVLIATAYAMVLGGVIGFEREMKDRPAGFRTHMLVAGAAALLVGLADLLAVRYSGEHYRELVRVDPLRLIEAVVAAVGFLGAGAIFRSGDDRVTGITTAASLLMVAAIGIAVGVHAHVLAFGATALTLAVLLILAWVERQSGARRRDSRTD
ncbi:MgtC/SapB family protein [Luteimonas notoginsengisoli]|uniref:Protein MgtC n=1 Tax=Luteimonas notoginsengisoli TaxID=1578200 RepID=A0ABV7UUS8_9GAMM